MPDSDIMTLRELAEYLHCHPSTLYRSLRSEKIPCFRLGSDWRFRRGDIDKWISKKIMAAT